MLGALERSRENERRFLADASHELRTPVTSLRGNVEYIARHGASPEVIADLERDAARLARLVDDLLVLERVGAVAQEPRPVELDSVLDTVLAGYDGGWRGCDAARSSRSRSTATPKRSPGRSRTSSRTRSCTALTVGPVTVELRRHGRVGGAQRQRRGTRADARGARASVRAVLARPRDRGAPRFRAGALDRGGDRRAPPGSCRGRGLYLLDRAPGAAGSSDPPTGRRILILRLLKADCLGNHCDHGP